MTRPEIHDLLQKEGYNTTPDHEFDLEGEKLKVASSDIGCTYYRHKSDEGKWMATWPIAIEENPNGEHPKRLKYDYAVVFLEDL